MSAVTTTQRGDGHEDGQKGGGHASTSAGAGEKSGSGSEQLQQILREAEQERGKAGRAARTCLWAGRGMVAAMVQFVFNALIIGLMAARTSIFEGLVSTFILSVARSPAVAQFAAAFAFVFFLLALPSPQTPIVAVILYLLLFLLSLLGTFYHVLAYWSRTSLLRRTRTLELIILDLQVFMIDHGRHGMVDAEITGKEYQRQLEAIMGRYV